MNEDDIFAGAGDHTGIELGEDSASEAGDAGARAEHAASDGETPDAAAHRWVDVDDGPVLPPRSASPPPAEGGSPARPQDDAEGPERAQEQLQQPARLQPLASTAVPSIHELLAMDETQEREAKRRARLEKKGKKAAGDESE